MLTTPDEISRWHRLRVDTSFQAMIVFLPTSVPYKVPTVHPGWWRAPFVRSTVTQLFVHVPPRVPRRVTSHGSCSTCQTYATTTGFYMPMPTKTVQCLLSLERSRCVSFNFVSSLFQILRSIVMHCIYTIQLTFKFFTTTFPDYSFRFFFFSVF